MTSSSARATMLRLIDESGKRLGKLSSYDFYTAWTKYDADGSGFIEEAELGSFLKEYLMTIGGMKSAESLTTKGLQELSAAFLAEHDGDKDGRISIHELSALLPTDQTFLLIFRQNNPLESSEQFMQVWKQYDVDKSGYIEAGELKNFLADILKNQKLDTAKLEEYSNSLLAIFDANKDGKLSLSEAAQLLPVKENFLRSAATKANLGQLNASQIEAIFKKYDRDNSGSIAAMEIEGLCKDILSLGKKDFGVTDIETLKDVVIRGCDLDGDGKIDQKELMMILQAVSKGE